ETTVSFGEGIILGSAHVKQLIETLVRTIVIPKRSVELHVQTEQRSVGTFEFIFKVAGATATINIVSQHKDEIEENLFLILRHSLSDLIFLWASRAVITNYREADRVGLQRQR